MVSASAWIALFHFCLLTIEGVLAELLGLHCVKGYDLLELSASKQWG